MSKIPVSVLVQTKNEEKAIRKCLEHLQEFDEVIVIDSNSDDCTKNIAEACGARVVNFTWSGSLPKKKQWQIDCMSTKNPWVLFIDADEYPSDELIKELQVLFTRSRSEGAFDIRLGYTFAGRRLRHGHRVIKRSLIHREHTSFPQIDDIAAPGMGELEGHFQPVSRRPIGRLRGLLEHDDPDPVSSWFSRHNKYSDWEAYVACSPLLSRDIRRVRSRQGQAFRRIPGKPVAFFLYSYFVRMGLLDGRAGLDYALALSFYYWQTELKIRELQRIAKAARP